MTESSQDDPVSRSLYPRTVHHWAPRHRCTIGPFGVRTTAFEPMRISDEAGLHKTEQLVLGRLSNEEWK